MRALLRACVVGGVVLGAVLAPAFSGAAAVSQEEIRELRAQIAALSERLAELEERAGIDEDGNGLEETAAPAPAPEPTPAPAPRADHWTDRVAFSGDFRYRWETIDQEGSDSRERHRIRARPAIVAQVNETVRTGFGLTTGGDNPVSANQTLGGGGTSKAISLDLAYFEWSALENTRILGGKFKRPLLRPGDSSLLWDDDWRPEGFAVLYNSGSLFGTAMATWLEGDSRAGDEVAFALQGGGSFALGRGSSLSFSGGYYQIDVAGRQPLYEEAEFFGNSFAPDGSFLYDYHLLEVGGELDFVLGDWPVSVFADYARNLEAGEYDTGWALGGTLGRAKDIGGWRIRYFYQDLEADAALGLLTDSNFGDGGTDARGHVLTADYVIASNWVFRLTYFDNVINENAVDRGVPGAEELDYDRLILDFRYKY